MSKNEKRKIDECIARLSRSFLAPLDLLPHSDLSEKLIDLVLNGEPANLDAETHSLFHTLRRQLIHHDVEDIRVVVFGGGSGLSNVIGGDSRLQGWAKEPFVGLKEVFPWTTSVVCVTDDGGSTGELIKDVPLIAIGDIRHVLLSSVQMQLLQKKYDLTEKEAHETVTGLSFLFNLRFKENSIVLDDILNGCADHIVHLPAGLQNYILLLLENIFLDNRLKNTLHRPHCLGNLIIVSAIYKNIDATCDVLYLEEHPDVITKALYKGLAKLTEMIGAVDNAVIPCTTTPSRLRVRYTNGVQVTGESKSASAIRGYPVDRVRVDSSHEIYIFEQVFRNIENADIIIMAPGSLYSSIIPIFQSPGIAEAVRKNKHASKMLISNLWVQGGETDIAISDPERKFHVSDMIRAYERNIPGGIEGLFEEVLCLSLKDVPASILQNYAVEGKVPIYLDKSIVFQQNFHPIECGIFSKKALAERGVIQHDPEILANVVKTIFVGSKLKNKKRARRKSQARCDKYVITSKQNGSSPTIPSKKYRILKEWTERIDIRYYPDNHIDLGKVNIRSIILDILWKHQDIPLSHLHFVNGITCVDVSEWRREQKWDKVYSFFDPVDFRIKIRSDQLLEIRKFELALLIALGQSLLGNYAGKKEVDTVIIGTIAVGKIYHLILNDQADMKCFFTKEELNQYLHLARMQVSDAEPEHFTRLISGNEGFTPPGLLMGLIYAWYLDNRLASHIEYKMALMQISESDLIPEQQKMLKRRELLIRFFREVVFCH